MYLRNYALSKFNIHVVFNVAYMFLGFFFYNKDPG
jgi:hypothetical protein